MPVPSAAYHDTSADGTYQVARVPHGSRLPKFWR